MVNAVRILIFLQILFYYKIFYEKKLNILRNDVLIDLYINIDEVVSEGIFSDKYFSTLYPVLEEENKLFSTKVN